MEVLEIDPMLKKFRVFLSPIEISALILFFISLILLLSSPSPDEAYHSALYVVNTTGDKPTLFLKDPKSRYSSVAWSPDGRRIIFRVFGVDQNKSELYIADANGSNQRQLTNAGNFNYYPAWSPDNRHITFASGSLIDFEPFTIYLLDVDGKEKKKFTATQANEVHSSWSPEGKQIAYDVFQGDTYQIFIAKVDGSDAHFIASGFYPDWSPDGRKIIFLSNGEEKNNILVINSDGTNQHSLISNGNWNTNPSWSPDGQWLAYIAGPIKGPLHVFVARSDGSESKDLLSDSDLDARTLSWSSDGNRILFSAFENSQTIKDYHSSLFAALMIKVISTALLLMAVLFLLNRRLTPRLLFSQPSNSIHETISHLDIIRNPLLKWIFRILPWLLILVTIIGLTPAFNWYPPALRYFLSEGLFYYSGFATAAISLLIFQVLWQRIPEAFRALWNRNVIAAKDIPPDQEPNVELERQYRGFVEHLYNTLNHPRQAIMAITCGLLGASWITYALNPTFLKEQLRDPNFVFQFLFAFGVGYIVGLQAWRMIVVGYEIGQLGRKFNLQLQLGHPDGCAGLAPVGDLCLWNALIICPAGIDLGFWLIFGNTGYESLLYILLFVILAIASASFFAPLWNIHRIMAIKKDEVRQQLDQLGENMNRLARQLLERANELEPTESEKLAKSLERMRQTYADNRAIPTWPFDTKTLMKFITSQIVPLLSLTGLAQPIRDIIYRLADFFNR